MTVQPGLCRTRSETPKKGFLTTRLIWRWDLGFKSCREDCRSLGSLQEPGFKLVKKKTKTNKNTRYSSSTISLNIFQSNKQKYQLSLPPLVTCLSRHLSNRASLLFVWGFTSRSTIFQSFWDGFLGFVLFVWILV